MRPPVSGRPDGAISAATSAPVSAPHAGGAAADHAHRSRFAEGMTVKDLADKLEQRVKDVLDEAARQAPDDDHQQHARHRHRAR